MLLFLLSCTPEPTNDAGHTADTALPEREWREVTTYPCGVDVDGYVECWRSRQWEDIKRGHAGEEDAPYPYVSRLWPIAPSVHPMAIVDADNPILAWGVRADNGEPAILACNDSDCVLPPRADYDAIAYECGLADGEMICWGNMRSLGLFEPTKTYTHFAGRGSSYVGTTYVALDTDNVLHHYDNTDYSFPPELEVETLVGFDNQNACALTPDGTIVCVGSNPPTFDNPPYRMLSGAGMAVCAARDDWTIECADGSTYDFGPLRHMSAESRLTYVLDEDRPPFYRTVHPTRNDPPHLCVVTQTNAIRCVGWRYDFDDLQRALPQGDEE